MRHVPSQTGVCRALNDEIVALDLFENRDMLRGAESQKMRRKRRLE
jgi:hypothetical protein